MAPTRVIIDTDPGIDDALALILAFASPELSVEAITTVAGNVTVEQASRNACAILEVIDPHPRPPVAGVLQKLEYDLTNVGAICAGAARDGTGTAADSPFQLLLSISRSRIVAPTTCQAK